MPKYEVTLGGFSLVEASSPLEAAKYIASIIQEDASIFVYNVEDEETNIEYSVDLSDETVTI